MEQGIRFLEFPAPLSYLEGLRIQQDLQEKRILDQISDTIVFLEHEPIRTMGRGLQKGVHTEEHLSNIEEYSIKQNKVNIPTIEVNRGGGETYHGPGQLMVYFICKLGDGAFLGERDISKFLRKVEQVFIELGLSFGLHLKRHPNATGVWTQDKKLVSIGISVRKWVTMHGAAININNDLDPFYTMAPCGFHPRVMTNLSFLGVRADKKKVIESLKSIITKEYKS